MISPCITNCLTFFVCAQTNKLQHAVPVQQGYIKLQLTTEKTTHPLTDTTIRTLGLETSKRGGPMPFVIPTQQEVARDLNVPIPKELGLPSLEGEILGS